MSFIQYFEVFFLYETYLQISLELYFIKLQFMVLQ